MDHRQALTTLLAYAERPGTPPPELQAAIAHLSTCPACTAASSRLLETLGRGDEDRLTCDECEDLLPEYLAAMAQGRGADPVWDALRVHLAGCPACEEALADLAELQAFARGELGVEPPAYPAPPLPAAHSSPGWRIDQLGRLLVDLAQALVPTRAPALAGLKQAPGQSQLAEARLSETLPDLELHIAVEGRPESERRTLVVTVTIPSRGGWPNLGGSEVVLLSAGAELDRTVTDAFGTAAFSGLHASAIQHYSLAIRPGTAPAI